MVNIFKNFFIYTCFVFAALWTEAHCAQKFEGNCKIMHAPYDDEKSRFLLSWEADKKGVASPVGNFAQILTNDLYVSSDKAGLYGPNGEWKNSIVWNIQKEGEYYTIRNVALDCGFLCFDESSNKVQLLKTVEGYLRDNMLWQISENESTGFYTIKLKNKGFLSDINTESNSGTYISVLENNDSYLEISHPMVHHVHWDFSKVNL